MAEPSEEEEQEHFVTTVTAQPYMFEPTQALSARMTLTPSIDSISPNETVLNEVGSCSCGKCVRSHTSFSSLCCQKSTRIVNKMGTERTCITETPAFKVMCLNEEVLRVSFRRTITIRKKRRKSSREVFDNSARRWTAYSQFIFWIYDGILGESIRKILPTCVYDIIRQTFPSVNCEYSDFRPGDNDDIFID